MRWMEMDLQSLTTKRKYVQYVSHCVKHLHYKGTYCDMFTVLKGDCLGSDKKTESTSSYNYRVVKEVYMCVFYWVLCSFIIF